jgi:hypothetical protein
MDGWLEGEYYLYLNGWLLIGVFAAARIRFNLIWTLMQLER